MLLLMGLAVVSALLLPVFLKAMMVSAVEKTKDPVATLFCSIACMLIVLGILSAITMVS